MRFLALAPGGNILAETDLGKVAASAYAAAQGVSLQDFIDSQRGGQPQLTVDQVASAVVELASDPEVQTGKSFLVSGAGITLVS